MTDMRDVDHTHPETADAFGDAFRRGPDVAADGGTPEAEDEANERTTTDASETVEATMDDVDHTSTNAVDRTFERGTEGRSDTV